MSVNIKKNQVLRYLGYKGQEIDDLTDGLIEESISEIKNQMNPKSMSREFQISRSGEKIVLQDTSLVLSGSSIYKHLKDCKSCLLLGLTLGHSVDKIIRYYQKTSMAKAIILDACASAAIEDLADNISKELENKYKKKGISLTSRFSPGYGDLDIGIQKSLLDLLDGSRTIGVSASSHRILIPRKSITAVIGLSHETIKKEKKSCKTCNKYNSCNFTKGDGSCGN